MRSLGGIDPSLRASRSDGGLGGLACSEKKAAGRLYELRRAPRGALPANLLVQRRVIVVAKRLAGRGRLHCGLFSPPGSQSQGKTVCNRPLPTNSPQLMLRQRRTLLRRRRMKSARGLLTYGERRVHLVIMLRRVGNVYLIGRSGTRRTGVQTPPEQGPNLLSRLWFETIAVSGAKATEEERLTTWETHHG